MTGVLVVFIVFAAVAGALIVYLIVRHKERLAMIEKGVSLADLQGDLRARPLYPLANLKWGLLAGFVGVGLFIADWMDRSLNVGDSIYFASMLIFGGLALVIFYFIASKKLKSE
jgi:sorbitol-specific phosphotransferase system component IIBC